MREFINILLEEDRRGFLARTYGEKVFLAVEKYEKTGNSRWTHLFTDQNDDPEYPFSQGTRDERVIEWVAHSDPTPHKIYTEWLCKLLISGVLRIEDKYKAHEYLEKYNQIKSRLPVDKRNIRVFKSIQDLFLVIEPFMHDEPLSNKAEERALALSMAKPEQSQTLLDNDNFKIVIPFTEEASCYFGRGTQWCTAATKSRNYFFEYSHGNLFIIFDKKEKQKYQLYIPPNTEDINDDMFELRDYRDVTVNAAEFFANRRDVWKAIDDIVDNFYVPIVLNGYYADEMKVLLKKSISYIYCITSSEDDIWLIKPFVDDKNELDAAIYGVSQLTEQNDKTTLWFDNLDDLYKVHRITSLRT
jgi:hypothetical protein